MSARQGREWEASSEGGRAGRLRMLAAFEDEGDAAALLAALHHLTAEFGALGGMAHLPVAGIGQAGLRLVASSGLPAAFTRAWDVIPSSGRLAPARVVLDGGTLWLPAVEYPRQEPGRPVAAPPFVAPSAGIAAAALPGPDGPRGALSLITPPLAEPDAADLSFLAEVAAWAAGRLRLSAPRTGGLSPALLSPLEGPAQQRPRLRIGTWSWDMESGDFFVDQRFLAGIGIDWPPGGRMREWATLVHPEDRPYSVHVLVEAIRTRGSYEAEYRVATADRGYAWVRVRGRVDVDEHGEPARLEGTVYDTTEAHAALEPVGRALRHMTDGFLSVDSDWRIEFVNVAAEKLLGSAPSVAGTILWDLPAIRHVPRLEQLCREVVRTGTPLDFDVRWPDDRWYHLRLVPVPGGLTLYSTDITERRLREIERAAAERVAADRSELIGGLTAALAEALTPRDVVDAVAGCVLPQVGAVGLLVATVIDGRLAVTGAVGYPDAMLDALDGRPVGTVHPTVEVMRRRRARFIESRAEFLASYPGTGGLVRTSDKQAWAFLPLRASGREGVCVVSFDRPHTFAKEQRTLLGEVSGLISQALDRAGLYEEAATRARELQSALLPRELPALPAVTAAARYLPAGHGAEVGGDWYDVIRLSADRVALVVGDVMGHGMPEAATMGRLRTAVRTLSELELPPAEILGRLNDIVADLGDDSFVTCLYGVYDPVTHDLRYANAGHPPPAVVRPDHTVDLPVSVPDPPLGTAVPPFDTVTVSLPEGSLLVLCTDGLVESADRDVDAGLARLADTLRTELLRRPAATPNALCEAVTAALVPAGRPVGDDAVLLLARVHHLPPGDVVSWVLPDDPRAAGEARAHVRAQLAAWGLDELSTATELIVSELVGNVIRHAKGPIGLRLLRSRTLICEVSDASLTTPHIRHSSATDEGGRGLQLVAAVAGQWGVRYDEHGKSIWTEQPIAGS
ncbi:SpoIIE family protein phosphatase [Kitasatospora terrestris]|uniref:SpoIIE family protein phosphatase n=1 Tax=Kitasatospora terrestris TaxID=258051 RepID=A0ABP9ERC3_9ACTN